MSADTDEKWRAVVAESSIEAQLAVLWGKSKERGGGRMNLLLQHLFDTMAVGSLIWDHFLARGLRRRLDGVAGGNGRRLYAWLCGLHDVGKATPAFQRMVPELAERVRAAGLCWPLRQLGPGETWRHERGSALVLRETLAMAWSNDREQLDWIWPMVAGHHGLFPGTHEINIPPKMHDRRRVLHGDASWRPVQELLVHIITAAAGWADLAAAQPQLVPSRADQLALSGFVTMADWIASDEHRFVGIDRLEDTGVEIAVERAEKAWAGLRLGGGWDDTIRADVEIFPKRFGRPPRPLQQMVIAAATDMAAPGLMVVEAPMGEGKTEAALAACEVLAARFGANGIYVAMPTQATSDAMYERVRDWLGSFEGPLPLALLHGRRLMTEDARSQAASGDEADESADIDEYGLVNTPPSFASVCEDRPPGETRDRPAEWFLGRHRGLLTANGVGTIDQALYAGTRTKYVSLRYAGLASKVVVFDEVHAADAYMAQFLGEVLRWLGNGRVPVVLLSATLSPAQREHLVTEYLEGATVATRAKLEPVPPLMGYPRVLTACADDRVRYHTRSSPTWRQNVIVEISYCEETEPGDFGPVADKLRDLLGDGGCALVVRNTVRRAQQTYRALEADFGEDVVLLHSRFTSTARARTTERLLQALGPNGRLRPRRLVVVATQVAEQSFDVDADLLLTDLAPIDLLLQRAGRAHRHERPASARPPGLRVPRVVIAGLRLGSGAPWFPRGSEDIYGRHNLLRSAALVGRAVEGGGWSLPQDIPDLVAEAYGEGPLVPASWSEDAACAHEAWKEHVAKLRSSATPYLLTVAGQGHAATLAGLHVQGGQPAEGHVRVRDGDMSEEVVLVIKEAGEWRTVDGLRLGPNGDGGRDRAKEVLGAGVRLPEYDPALVREIEGLGPLPGWKDDPWLGSARALQLDPSGRVQLGNYELVYDPKLGLLVDRLR
jgi:CRISPR-associated endonuclease/helicase Cas3